MMSLSNFSVNSLCVFDLLGFWFLTVRRLADHLPFSGRRCVGPLS
jgi:hypothetical protein